MHYTNEAIWAGEFGDKYHERNPADDRKAMWENIVKHLDPLPQSVIELGAGKGENLVALHSVLPELKAIVGIDINLTAVEEMNRHPFIDAWQGSAWDFEDISRYDMVITRGFLIHVPKFALPGVLKGMGTVAKHVVMIEYMATEREEIPYHGSDELLWEDDFEGEFLNQPLNRRNWSIQHLGIDPFYKTSTIIFSRK